jgi:large subunit ribosomal protein L25
MIPAVVYGHGTDSRPISVDAHDLHLALHTDAGSNKHPFRSEYRHVDFVAISLDEKITAEVNIHFEGSPIGVREGGVFSPRRTSVEVLTLASSIPDFIELDVSDVELGGSLRIADLPQIEGVEYTEDLEGVVMSVTAPAAEIVEEVEEVEMLEGEEVEGEEGAEGEEGEESGEDGSAEEAPE